MFRIFLALLLLTFSHGVDAQIGNHTVGVLGGAFAKRTLTARSYPNAELNVSPAAGVFYSYRFSKRIGAETSFLFRKEYDKRVYTLVVSENDPDGPGVTLRHNYINVPVRLVVGLNNSEQTNWRVNALFGGSVQKYLGSVARSEFDGEKVPGEINFYLRKPVFFADGGLEIGYVFKEVYAVSLNAAYRYQLFDDNRDKGFYSLVKFGRMF